LKLVVGDIILDRYLHFPRLRSRGHIEARAPSPQPQ
jgi:hypothetical protein